MGASFHTPSPPIEVYWPREHSSRNNGTPANIRVKKYGIKKAPVWTKVEQVIGVWGLELHC